MTVIDVDYGKTLSEHERRLYNLEQRITNPAVIHSNEFGEVVVGPPGNQVVITSAASPPTGMVLTPGSFYENVYVDVSWTPPVANDVVEYEVECARKTAPSTYELKAVRRTLGTSMRFDGLDPVTTYGFKVYGINRIGVYSTPLPGAGMQEVTTSEDSTIPNLPTNVSITAGFRTITIGWDEPVDRDVVDGHGLFEVQLDITSSFNTGSLQSKRVSGEITSFGGLLTGTTYYGRVASIDSSGNQSAYTTPVSAVTGGISETDVQDAAITARKTRFSVGGGNMAVNSSYEDTLATANWVAYGAQAPTVTNSNEQARYGTRSLKVVFPSGAPGGISQGSTFNLEVFTQQADETLTLSAWIYGGTQTNLSITYNGSTGIGDLDLVETLASGWKRYAKTWKNTHGVSRAESIYIAPRTTLGATLTIYVDAFQAEHGDILTAYSPRPDELLTNQVQGSHIASGAVIASKTNFTVGGGNLVRNSSFEWDSNNDGTPDDWQAYTGVSAITNPSSSPYHGSRYLRFTVDGATSIPRVWCDSNVLLPQNMVHTVSAWMRATAGLTMTLGTKGMTGAGAEINTGAAGAGGINVIATGVWQRLSYSINLTDISSVGVRITLGLSGTPVAGTALEVDGVQLEYGDIPTAYSPAPDEIGYQKVSTFQISDGSVTTSKVGDNQVTTAKMADGSVTASKVNFAIGGENLISNSSFEVDSDADGKADSWNAYGAGGTISYSITSPSDAPWGSKVQGITTTSVNVGEAGWMQVLSQKLPAGTKFVASAYFKTPAGVTQVRFIYRDETNSNTWGADFVTVPANTWTRVIAPVRTVPVGLKLERVYFVPLISNANGVSAFIDAAQLEVGEIATSYSPNSAELSPGSVQNEHLANGSVSSSKTNFEVGGGNLVRNSSVESSDFTGNWMHGGGASAALSRSADARYHGDYTLKSVISANGTYEIFTSDATVGNLMPITASSKYVWTIYARMASGTKPVAPVIYWYTSAGVAASTPSVSGPTVAINATGWIRLQLSGTSPSNAAYARCSVSNAAAVTGETFYLDGAQFEAGDVPTAYSPKPDEFLPGSVTGQAIAGDSIQSYHIQAGQITADKTNFAIGGGNMLRNSSLEVDPPTNGWVQSGSPSWIDNGQVPTTTAYRGSNVWRMTELGNVSGAQRGIRSGSTSGQFSTLVARPGERWTGSFYARANTAAAGSARSRVRFLNSSGAEINAVEADVNFAATGVWYRPTVTTAAAPAGTAFVEIFALILSSGVDGRSYDIDALQLELGELVTAYAPKPDEITPGSITATEIADNAVTTPKLIAEAVVTAKIATGAVTADRIAAGAVTTEKLTVGSFAADNLVVNGGFEEAKESNANDAAQWTNATVAGSPGHFRTNAQRQEGSYSFSIVCGTNTTDGYSYQTPFSPVQEGEVLTAQCWYKASVASASGIHIGAYFYDASLAPVGSNPNYALMNAASTTAWQQFSGQLTVPTNARFMRPTIRYASPATPGTAYFDGFNVFRTTTSVRIQDGAIIAPKIAAGAVTTEKLVVAAFSDNANLNPKFEDGLNGYEFTSPLLWSNPTISDAVPSEWTGVSSFKVARLTASTNTTGHDFFGTWIPLDTSATFYVEVWARKTSDPDDNRHYFGIHVDDLTQNGGHGRYFAGLVDIPSTWTKYTAAIGSATVTGGVNVPWTQLGTSRKFRVEMIGPYTSAGAGGNSRATIEIASVVVRRLQVSALIADGAVTTDKLVANSVVASKIAANAVTATQVQAGAITATKIAAGAVTMEKLTVGIQGPNVVANNGFEEVSEGNATRASLWQYNFLGNDSGGITYNLNTAGANLHSGSRSLSIAAAATTDQATVVSRAFPVNEGEVYALESWFKGSVAAADGFYLALIYGTTETFSGAGTATYIAANVAIPTSWALSSGQVTVPAGMTWARVLIQHWLPATATTLYVDSVTTELVSNSVRIQDGAVVAAKVAADAITATKIQAGAVVAGKIAANAVTATELAASSVTSTKVAAGAVTAEKLSIYTVISDNLAPNGSFEEIAESNANRAARWTDVNGNAAQVTISIAERFDGDRSLAIAATTAELNYVYSDRFPVTADTYYSVEAWFKASVAASNCVRFGIIWYTNADAFINSSNPALDSAVTTSWALASGQYQSPSTARWARLICQVDTPTVNTTVYFDAVEARVTSGAVQIQDGAIIAPKIATDAVTAVKIQAGAITAGKIAADAVTATTIAAGAVTMEKLTVGSFSENLVVNGGFEEAKTGVPSQPARWTCETTAGTAATFSLSNAVMYEGNLSLAITAPDATTSARAYNIDFLPVPTGQTLAVEGWFRGSVAMNSAATVLVFWYNSVSGFLSSITVIGNENATTSWAFFSGQVVPPANATYFKVACYLDTPSVAGTIYYDAIQARTVASSVRIQDGAIVAAKIAAGAVTAEKLTVATFGANSVANGSFEEMSSADATLPSGWSRNVAYNTGTGQFALGTDVKNSGLRAVQYTAAATSDSHDIWSKSIPVVPGELWHCSAWYRSAAASADGLHFRADFAATENSGTAANIAVIGTNDAATTQTWQRMEGQVTVPAGMYWMRLFVIWYQPSTATTLYIDDVSAQRVVVSAQIQDGAIVANKLAANSVVAGKIAANAVTSTEIAAGAVTATKIAVGAITTETLSVGVFGDSIVPNGSFEDASSADVNIPAHWVAQQQVGTPTFARTNSQRTEGAWSLGITCSTTSTDGQVISNQVPCKPSTAYALEAWFKASAASADGVLISVYWFDATGTFVGSGALVNNGASTTSWVFAEGMFTSPSTATNVAAIVRYSAPATAGTCYFDGVKVREVSNAVRIADGAVIAPKIATDAVTATKIQAGSIVAGKIAADAVGATEIAADAITAEHLAAGSVTTESITIAVLGANIVANGGFEETVNGAPTQLSGWTYNWQTSGGGATIGINSTAANLKDGFQSLSIAPAGSTSGSSVASMSIPVVDGERYHVSGWYKASAGSADGVYLRASFGNVINHTSAQQTSQVDVVFDGASTTAWQLASGQVVVPAGAKFMRIVVYYWEPTTNGTLYWDVVSSLKAIGSTVIEPNAVTAEKIVAATITSDKISTAGLDAAHIKFGTMSGDRITANTLDVASLKTSTMTAQEITLSGGISGGRLKAGNPLGGAGTSGMYIDSNGVRIYKDGSVVITLDAGTGSGTFKGTITSGTTITGATVQTTGATILISDTDGLKVKGSGSFDTSKAINFIYPNTTTTAWRIWTLSNSPSPILWIQPDQANIANSAIQIETEQFYLQDSTGTDRLEVIGQNAKLRAHLTFNDGFRMKGNSDSVTNQAPGFNTRGGANTVSFDWNAGTFQNYVDTTNVKNFVIDHPVDPERHLIHTTLEGPENAVFYRGEGNLVDGICWVKLPDYFEALVKKKGRTVQVTPVLRHDDMPGVLPSVKKKLENGEFIQAPAQVGVPYLAVTEVIDGYFLVCQAGGFVKNDAKFFWEVKAIRKDVPALLVEPKKSDVDVHGYGPYKFFSKKGKDKEVTAFGPEEVLSKLSEIEQRIAELEGAKA